MIRSASRWLHSKTHPNVFSAVHSHGHRSDSLSQVAAFIELIGLASGKIVMLLRTFKFQPSFVRGSLPFIRPSSQTLKLNTSMSSPSFGSNGDPLARSGPELAHLPNAAISLFVTFAPRWELAGRAPAQMHQARMATIPDLPRS